MIHLVLQSSITPFRDIGQFFFLGLLYQFVGHTIYRFIIHFPVHGFLLSPLNPHFEQIFIKRVPHGPEADLSVGEPNLVCMGVPPQLVGIEPVLWFYFFQHMEYLLRGGRILSISRDRGQISKLHLQRGHLRQHVGSPQPSRAPSRSLLQQGLSAGQPRLGIERGQQPIPQIHRLGQKHGVPAAVVRRQQSPQRSNGGLERADGVLDVVMQLRPHPLFGPVELLVQLHDPEGVQAVHQGVPHAAPVLHGAVGEGAHLVFAEGVLLVAAPGVAHGVADGVAASAIFRVVLLHARAAYFGQLDLFRFRFRLFLLFRFFFVRENLVSFRRDHDGLRLRLLLFRLRLRMRQGLLLLLLFRRPR
mmetsp:Transcript_15692/g.35330  ORF Transcript_15692/g.35330 Transcript_15692/m.35330 type:complete len:359 (-) Transcript_15692:76-1152(-)